MIEYLLQHGANPNVDDLDTYTPFELFFVDHNHVPSSIPPSILSLFTPSKDLETARIQRKQILLERKIQKKKQLREYVASRYTPKYQEIFKEWRDDMFHETFLNFVYSEEDEKGMMERLKGIVDEVAPRVYAFQLFSLDYCRY